MSERVLHEFGRYRIVVGQDGNPAMMYRSVDGSYYKTTLTFGVEAELARLATENAKLRACVRAADEMRFVPAGEFSQVIAAYDAARAEVDK